MLIPSPVQIRDAIAAIPLGQTRTTSQLRAELAKEAGADVTCPFATNVGWRLVAEAADEECAESGQEPIAWWRLTKDRKPYAKLPGGEERHRALLRAEGVLV